MSKIKIGGLDQYGAEPYEQQQFGTAVVEGVNGCQVCLRGQNNNYVARNLSICAIRKMHCAVSKSSI